MIIFLFDIGVFFLPPHTPLPPFSPPKRLAVLNGALPVSAHDTARRRHASVRGSRTLPLIPLQTMSRGGRGDPLPGRASEFGAYMAAKVAKLGDQFGAYAAAAAADAGASCEDGALFRGVVVHVNGFTVPSAAVRANGERERERGREREGWREREKRRFERGFFRLREKKHIQERRKKT